MAGQSGHHRPGNIGTIVVNEESGILWRTQAPETALRRLWIRRQRLEGKQATRSLAALRAV